MTRARRQMDHGVSTLEILIAITVISIAALASYRSLSQSAVQASGMDARIYAMEVARNRAEEIKLMGVAAARGLPETEKLGPIEWRIETTEEETAVGLIEVAIVVSSPSEAGARLVTYMPLRPTQ